ncbi:hypothetical protein GCM10027051_22620 [Niabella terrae]
MQKMSAKTQKNYYIIDFDSTFTQVEALDELARISLKSHPEKEEIYRKISDYTNQAMEGKLSFSESLAHRVRLLEANKDHLKKLISHLKKQVSKSFSRNASFFKKHTDEVLIVSGGFKEFITPVVKKFGIKKENIYANTFVFDKAGKIIGYDDKNPLSSEGGKVTLLKQLNLQGHIYGIGDGYSDFQLRESGVIKKFFAFTENISRKSVTAKADHITPSFDEFLYVNQLPGAISYPKNRIHVLVMGTIDPAHLGLLTAEGYTIASDDPATAPDIRQAGILLLGPGIVLEATALKKASRLKAIGCYGEADRQLPLERCTDAGIVVFDQPAGGKAPKAPVEQRIINFINKGAISHSVNFPGLQLPAVSRTHRIIHIHKNQPGVIARFNTILAEHRINISAQYLMTNARIGYVITDIEKNYDKQLLRELKKIEHTIKFRVLY